MSSYVNLEASFNKPITSSRKIDKYSDLPRIKLPLINTLINNTGLIKLEFDNKIRNVIKVAPDVSENYIIDKNKQVIVFPNGKEFKLNSLTNLSSRTGKSIEKSEAMELANDYLKLAIPSKSKKDIFIKAIREKLKLD